MAFETFEAGYAGVTPARVGAVWTGVWKLNQVTDRLITKQWPQAWNIIGSLPVDSDISGAVNFSVSGQESSPTSLFFKPDGSKFYVAGTTNQTVYQYTCVTPWDTSTASYDLKSFGVSTQETSPQALTFKTDGTKFYVIGLTNDTVYQYSCSTAWDVSTASYDSKSFSVASFEGNPRGLAFKTDGTKFYVIGSDERRLFQFSCSTAWDVSTASYDEKSYFVGMVTTGNQGVTFKDDGTSFFVVSSLSGFQYTCETPWSVNTASFDYVTNTVISGATELAFKPDGTKIFVISSGTPKVVPYNTLLT